MMKEEKTCAISDIDIYSTGAIYTCIIFLMSTSFINIENLLRYDLSPVQTSLFYENGNMRLNKQKCELKNSLEVEEQD